MNKTILPILLSITVLTFAIAASEIPSAFASPVTINLENGHYYQYVEAPGISWTDAKLAAENSSYYGVGGHLVTITSQSENDFVVGLHSSDFRPWIGLSYDHSIRWYKWVTNEPFDVYNTYKNWSPGAPWPKTEHYVELFKSNGKWNNNTNDNNYITGYVVEYNPIPFQNPITRHYYQYVEAPGITWTGAKQAAENSSYYGVNGHLVTPTTAFENLFLSVLIPDDFRVWIGLSDKDSEGEYQWATGEPFNYSNWDSNQPDNYNNNEHYVEFLESSERWNDLPNDGYGNIDGYVIEYTTPPVQNPVNGHYYQYVEAPGITWTNAKQAAENSSYYGLGGHLVTPITANENLFLLDLIPNDSRVWIGYSDEDSETYYKWVTGEPLIYTNWAPTQPDNDNNNEHYVEFLGWNGKWNDLPNDGYGNIDGYVIEYTTPPVLNPENGHYYKYMGSPYTTWFEAHNAAVSHMFNGVNGHLVTITSASENDFVDELIPDDSHTWIGLTDLDSEGEYQWATGEPFNYSNWDSNQPDNHNNNEHYVEFLGWNGKWNDLPNENIYIHSYVIEYAPPPVQNPENGHYYKYVSYPGISWTDAHFITEHSGYNNIPAHLVTITSASENDFVANLVPDDALAWMGLTDEITEGEHNWITGEPFDYSNWATNGPDNSNNEDYGTFYGPDNDWDDKQHDYPWVDGYIVEYTPTQ